MNSSTFGFSVAMTLTLSPLSLLLLTYAVSIQPKDYLALSFGSGYLTTGKTSRKNCLSNLNIYRKNYQHLWKTTSKTAKRGFSATHELS